LGEVAAIIHESLPGVSQVVEITRKNNEMKMSLHNLEKHIQDLKDEEDQMRVV
jgi:hypothetical protein